MIHRLLASNGGGRGRFGRQSLLIVALAGVLAFSRSWGTLVADGHFAFFVNPSRQVRDLLEIWNGGMDFGGVDPKFAPFANALMAILRGVGFEPWVAQRMWFFLLLASVGVGTAALTRKLCPAVSAAPVISGLAVLFAPFTVGFFLPTWLFVNAAIAPWLALFLWTGISSERQWSSAAKFALLFVIGCGWNPPGALWVLLMIVPFFLYAFASGQTSIQRSLGWIVRALILMGMLLPIMVFRIIHAQSVISENLASSEIAEAVSRSSSWSESLRGLGSWRQYWIPKESLTLPYIEPLLDNIPTIIASFVAVLVAALAITFTRDRIRLLLGSLMLISAAVMVGGYPLEQQAPLGKLLFALYDASDTAFSMRNVYKAGPGLAIGTSVLVGLGVARFVERYKGKLLRISVSAALLGTAMIMSTPWTSGAIFKGQGNLDGEIPSYWYEAAGWLNGQSSPSAVLVVPGTRNFRYRWGSAPNGDLFPSLINRPVFVEKPLSMSPKLDYSIIQAISDEITNGRYLPGTIAPIARRIGLRYIMVRNDLLWERSGIARPFDLEDLRNDPELHLVATFGQEGENTVREDDDSQEARFEAGVEPVQIFEVKQNSPAIRVQSRSASVLVSGDGAGWINIAGTGRLDEMGPIQYTGKMNPEDLVRAFEEGSQLIITDSNRRRLAGWGSSPDTLPDRYIDRNIIDNFGVEGSQTTVAFGDAVSIDEIVGPQRFRLLSTFRPSSAFDGDTSTSWLTGIENSQPFESIEVTFSRPRLIRDVAIESADVAGGRRVTAVKVFLDDDPPLLVTVNKGTARIAFQPEVVGRIRIQIEEVAQDGLGPYGISEISVGSLDFRERVVVPNDVVLRAKTNPRLRNLLVASPVSFVFKRMQGLNEDAETRIARQFETVTPFVDYLAGSLSLESLDVRTDPIRYMTGSKRDSCRYDMMEIDGTPIPLRIGRIVYRINDGPIAEFQSCDSVRLGPGVHDLFTSPDSGIFQVTVGTNALNVQNAPPISLQTEITSRGSSSYEIEIEPHESEALLFIGQAANRGWTATIGSSVLGEVQMFDGQAAWRVPDSASAQLVQVRFEPQKTYSKLGVLFCTGVLVSILLIIVDPKKANVRLKGSRRIAMGSIAMGSIAMASAPVFGFLVGGFVHLFLALGFAAAIRTGLMSSRFVAIVGTGLVIVAVFTTVPPLGPSLSPIGPFWPASRDTAHDAAQLSAVLFWVAIAGWSRERQEERVAAAGGIAGEREG